MDEEKRNDMKTKLISLLGLLLLVGFLTSCGDPIQIGFDETLIVGKWQEGSVFERYDSDGTGATWDMNDDVTEDEAQPFRWTLTGETLLQEHIMWNDVVVPKTFTVTMLSSNTLSYHDDYGVTHTFTKVN